MKYLNFMIQFNNNNVSKKLDSYEQNSQRGLIFKNLHF